MTCSAPPRIASQRSVRRGDTVARLGGDEFAILLEEDPSTAARQVAQAVLDAFARPIVAGGREFGLTASVGVVVSAGTADADALIRRADLAMYSAKSRGQGSSRGLHGRARRSRARSPRVRTDLRRALADGELEMYFQPIVELADHRTVGAEALMRWRHPDERAGRAARLHSDRRGGRARRRARTHGDHGRDRCRGRPATRARRPRALRHGEPLRPRAGRGRPPGVHRPHAAITRPRARRAGRRDDRIGAAQRSRDGDRTSCGAPQRRAPDRARRLRHRLLVAQLPRSHARGHPQAREAVRRCGRLELARGATPRIAGLARNRPWA